MNHILSNSSGKDSTAMLLLAQEKEIEYQSVFADTGNENPIVFEYLDYLEKKIGIKFIKVKADFSKQIARKRIYITTKWREEGVPESIIDNALSILNPTGNPFFDLCIWKGRFPSSRAQFCTSELKVIPITEQIIMPIIDQGGRVRSWQGVRADESKLRSGYKELETNGRSLEYYRPILKWTVEDVFSIHKKHGVKPNPLYKKGMGRVGCMPCINARKDEINEISVRFPEEIQRIKEWEYLVAKASKLSNATFFPPNKTPGTSINHISDVVSWSKTTRGGRNLDLLKQESLENTGCKSSYGLCDGGLL